MEEYKRELVKEYRKVLSEAGNLFESSDIKIFRSLFEPREGVDVDPSVAYPAVIKALNTALILLNEVNLGRVAIQSKLAYEAVKVGLVSLDKVEALFGAQVGSIVRGLVKANDIYAMNPSVESDNFRKLLLTMAQDIRVIIILICDRLYMMRILQNFPEGERMSIAKEVAYLYAPLAHRLGLYRIKSELEDLSLKYMNSDIYTVIFPFPHQK